MIELEVMLFGQDFRRSHQGPLPATGDGLQHGQGGDDGFAAADIPLKQPLHGVRLGQIGADFRPDTRLRLCEAERQCREKLLS